MNEQVYRKWLEIEKMPYGSARCAAAEELLRSVDATGPAELLPVCLLSLIEAYDFSGEGRKCFPLFARLLRLYDTKPEYFDDHIASSLFWQFKWIASSLYAYPEISKKQAYALLDDMENRFAIAGHGLKAPRVARFEYAYQTGAEDAETLRQLWLATPDDEFDDCPACVIGTQVDYLVQMERWEEAVAIGRTLTDECNAQPCATHHLLTLAELMLGNAHEAARHLRKANALLDRSYNANGFTAQRGALLAAVGIGGDAELLCKLLRTTDAQRLSDENKSLAMLRLLNGLHTGLCALFAGGVARDYETGLRQEEWRTLGMLHDWVIAAAQKLAALFDARNENTYFQDKLAAGNKAQPAPCPLPHATDSVSAAAVAAANTTTAATADANPVEAASEYPAGVVNAALQLLAELSAESDAAVSSQSPTAPTEPSAYTKQLLATESFARTAVRGEADAEKVAPLYVKLARLNPAHAPELLAEAGYWLSRTGDYDAAAAVYKQVAQLATRQQQLTATHPARIYLLCTLFTAWGSVAARSETLLELAAALDGYNTVLQNAAASLRDSLETKQDPDIEAQKERLQLITGTALRTRYLLLTTLAQASKSGIAAENAPQVPSLAQIFVALIEMCSTSDPEQIMLPADCPEVGHMALLLARLAQDPLVAENLPQELLAAYSYLQNLDDYAARMYQFASTTLTRSRQAKPAEIAKNEMQELLLRLGREF